MVSKISAKSDAKSQYNFLYLASLVADIYTSIIVTLALKYCFSTDATGEAEYDTFDITDCTWYFLLDSLPKSLVHIHLVSIFKLDICVKISTSTR